MILVDTSIWIDHVQHAERRLFELLQQGQVYSHLYVAGELAMGQYRQREDLLLMHTEMPQAQLVEPRELLTLVDSNHLYGSGIGYIDAHLLASVQLMGDTALWTRDKRLMEVARRLLLPLVVEYAH